MLTIFFQDIFLWNFSFFIIKVVIKKKVYYAEKVKKREEERVRMSVREKTDIIMYRKQEGKKEKREKDPL